MCFFFSGGKRGLGTVLGMPSRTRGANGKAKMLIVVHDSAFNLLRLFPPRPYQMSRTILLPIIAVNRLEGKVSSGSLGTGGKKPYFSTLISMFKFMFLFSKFKKKLNFIKI